MMSLNKYISYISILCIIIDPLTYWLLFNSLTININEFNKKVIISMKSSIISLILHILTIFFGNNILTIVDIPIYAMKITGGLSLLNTSYYIINSKNKEYHLLDGDEYVDRGKIYIYPLSTGILAGPGTLCTLIILSNECNNFMDYCIIIVSSITVIMICFLGTLLSKYISKINNDILDIMNIMVGLLLSSLSIKFIIDGIHSIKFDNV
jgi:multiple antibiotic resistance protein